MLDYSDSYGELFRLIVETVPFVRDKCVQHCGQCIVVHTIVR